MKDQLNAEEREILERFKRDELRPATGVDREMAIAPQAARNTFKKTRRVNLRVTERDYNRVPPPDARSPTSLLRSPSCD